MRKSVIPAFALCALLGACQFQDDAEPSPQRAQRDSVRNSQRTSGQRVVGRALDTADSAAARAQRTDSLLRQP